MAEIAASIKVKVALLPSPTAQVLALLDRKPITNKVWDSILGVCVAELRELDNNMLDPWGKPLAAYPGKTVTDTKTRSVNYWEYTVEKDGCLVLLRLFND